MRAPKPPTADFMVEHASGKRRIGRQKMAGKGHDRCLGKQAHKADEDAEMHEPAHKADFKNLHLQKAVENESLDIWPGY